MFTIKQLFGDTYYHSLVEELARVVPYLDFLKKNPDIMIHCSNMTKRYLTHLGLDPSRMRLFNYRAKVLYAPAGQACSRPSFFNLQLLSMELRNTIKKTPEERKSIVIMKRKDGVRHFNNFSTIVDAVKTTVNGTDIKVEIFDDSELPSLQETVAMFNRAFIVLGRHGAGFANMLFCEPGTVMIEGQCPDLNQLGYYVNLMGVLGHRYYGFIPRRGCNDPSPEEILQPLKYFLNNLYLRKSDSVRSKLA